MSMGKIVMKPRIFILSNGQLAEPQYFHDFRKHLKARNIKVLEYKRFRGKAPLEFIKAAVACKQQFQRAGEFFDEDVDQFWCVFDVDDYWKQNQMDFRTAIALAKKSGVRLAWSNECFELWFLCHFDPSSSAVPRRDYHKKLEKYFKDNKLGEYTKNMSQIFRPLWAFQQAGIKNAKKLYVKDKVEKNPSTAVFLLVEKLLNLSK